MRRSILGFLLSGLVGIAYTAASVAQKGPAVADYPTKPIRMLVAQGLNEAFRQPVIVDNRPGASGISGTEDFCSML